MSERTDELSDDQWVAIDIVMEQFGVGQRMAYKLASNEKWRKGGGGYLFGDVRATYARRKAEQATKRQRSPRPPRSFVTRHDTPP